jgi:hypothetical protein
VTLVCLDVAVRGNDVTVVINCCVVVSPTLCCCKRDVIECNGVDDFVRI